MPLGAKSVTQIRLLLQEQSDQTASTGAVWSGSTLYDEDAYKNFSRQPKQSTFVAISAFINMIMKLNIGGTKKEIFPY